MRGQLSGFLIFSFGQRTKHLHDFTLYMKNSILYTKMLNWPNQSLENSKYRLTQKNYGYYETIPFKNLIEIE